MLRRWFWVGDNSRASVKWRNPEIEYRLEDFLNVSGHLHRSSRQLIHSFLASFEAIGRGGHAPAMVGRIFLHELLGCASNRQRAKA